MFRSLLLGAAALALAACAHPVVETATAAGTLAPITPLNSSMLPMGTRLSARLNTPIGTNTNNVGDNFSATVFSDLLAQDNSVAVPAGAMLYGHITGLHAGSVGERALIRLDFDSLTFDGLSHPFDAAISSVKPQTQTTPVPGVTQRDVTTGAVAGAVLGAVVSGGELTRIVEGGLLGAAAGTVVSLGTQSDVAAVLPAGSMLNLTTSKNVYLR